MGLFSFLLPKKKLADTRFYIHDTVEQNTANIEKLKSLITDYIKKESNSNTSRPRIASVHIYADKPFDARQFKRRRVIVLTNYVNERSRKEEFDNMTFWNFLRSQFSIPNRAIGGNKEDIPVQSYELYYTESFVTLPVDPDWLHEDPAKISLFHNDYTVNEVIKIQGFDSDGEPEIRLMNNGSIIIAFNFMPPSNGEDHGGEPGEFENFDQYLEQQLGVKVSWTDREFFLIEQPKPDTAQKIKQLLENFWGKSSPGS